MAEQRFQLGQSHLGAHCAILLIDALGKVGLLLSRGSIQQRGNASLGFAGCVGVGQLEDLTSYRSPEDWGLDSSETQSSLGFAAKGRPQADVGL